MGTVQGAQHAFQAGSLTSAQLTVTGLRGELYGRETILCLYCGRVQFFKGRSICIVCRRPVLVPLEPLLGSDAAPAEEASLHFTRRICERLRVLREMLGISSSSLSSLVGCSPTHIWKCENLIASPTISFLGRLGDAFHLTLEEIFDESIPVEALALASLLHSPSREVLAEVARVLPRLNEHSKAKLLKTAQRLHRRRAPRRLGTALLEEVFAEKKDHGSSGSSGSRGTMTEVAAKRGQKWTFGRSKDLSFATGKGSSI